MDLTSDKKILIVGAGPTGLTAAVELARQGLRARVVEKRKQPSGFSRAVGITPQSLQLLAPSGVSQRLIENGIQVKRVKVFKAKKQSLDFTFAELGREYNYILSLPQDRTELILADKFFELGGEIEYGVKVEEVSQCNQKARVSFNDKSEQSYDFVIGADGVRSTVRERAGIHYSGFELEEKWSIADVDSQRWSGRDHFVINIPQPGVICIVVPIGPARYRLVSNQPDALKALVLDLEVDRIRRASSFSISIRHATRFKKGRIFLAGDAAHSHSPVGGRGMNLGIADAAKLVECLLNDRLDDYELNRKTQVMETIQFSERGRKIMTSANPVTSFLRSGALFMVQRLPPLRKAATRGVLGIDGEVSTLGR